MVRLFGSRKCLLRFYLALMVFVPIRAADAAGAKSETLLYSFQNNGADGNIPNANLTDVDGTLYGTTKYGGASNVGTVYSIDPSTGAEKVVYSFQNNGADGANPVAGLINVNGTLYGTTLYGGVSGAGTVFSITASTGAESVVYAFQNNDADGNVPYASLIAVNGTLYGTTLYGGANDGAGTVFSVTPSTGAESVLHSFSNEDMGGDYPAAGLINVNGTLYGTASLGGEFGNGAVFSINPSTGTYAVLYSFGNGGDGNTPESNLIYVRGTLYGTTVSGGPSKVGTVFSVNPSTGTEKVLYSFKNSGGDGKVPVGSLIDATDTLYGTTEGGGASGVGTVYSINTSTGAEKLLYSFKNKGGDGTLPIDGLMDFHKALYGTTTGGGTQNEGTVFKIKP